MSEQADPVTLSVARLRQHGYLPAAGLPVIDMERRADQAGLRVHAVADGEGRSVLVLGWQHEEPSASTQAPKLLRRTLSPSATKTLLVVHALATDPQTRRPVITTGQVSKTVELLAGSSGLEWVVHALRHTLHHAGLVSATTGGWRPGPRMQTWDAETRNVMDQSAMRLWQHPSWPEIT